MQQASVGRLQVIYADEAAMMRYCFGADWPRELTHIHEIAEQLYMEWTSEGAR